MSGGGGFSGPMDAATPGSEENLLAFVAQSILNGAATATLVQVKLVYPMGGPAVAQLQPGQVAVQPLVGQVDGFGQVTPHGWVWGLPYFWLQGGTNAVQIDPAIGDIGLAVFADHDITAVKASRAPAPPGSRRRFDMQDGVYLGAFPGLNQLATQFVQFLANGSGIIITTPTTITLNAGATQPVTINAQKLVVNGAIEATGNVTAGKGGADQVALQTHTHGGVQAGGSSTAAPNAGT